MPDDRAGPILATGAAVLCPAWCTAPLIRAHLDGVVAAWTPTGTELMTVEPGRPHPTAILDQG